jgi:hypothetical protein
VQVALVSNAVCATAAYGQSVQNMAHVSLERDNVLGEDGGAQQLGTVEGCDIVTLAVAVRL